MRRSIGRVLAFLRELRRRKVYGVAVGSAAVAWGIIEVSSVVLPTFHAPEWAMQLVVVVSISGFMLAVVLAWIYKLGPEGLEKDVTVTGPLVAPAHGIDPDRCSIVVLPFVERAANSEGQYICDGFTELLIARLAGIRSMSVISRTTAMRYRDSEKTIPQIAGELNVSHLVEGSVLRDGEQMQVVVQLVDGRTDRHVWAETYTRSMSDMLNLMNEIAGAVADEVRVKVTPEEEARLSRQETIDPQALDAYLRGRHHLSRRSAASFEKALAAFNDAIDLAPTFAAPYAGIADIHIMSAIYGFKQPKQSFVLARASAEKAIEYDSSSAEGYVSRGSIRMFHDWDFEGAEDDFLRALELNPSYPTGRLAYGDLLLIFERGEEALAQMEEAVRLDPLDLGMNMNLGDFLYFAGRFPDSAEQHRKVLAMNPGFFPSKVRLAKALACEGDGEGVEDILAELKESAPTAVWLETAAVTYGKLGERDKSRTAIKDWQAANKDYQSPLPVAWAYGALGDRDAAIEWLEQSFENRSPALILSHVQPMFQSLGDDPRFLEILGRIGIPATSARSDS
jgi:TolB-like protein/tetratricopeptide (TPR) repeat protein